MANFPTQSNSSSKSWSYDHLNSQNCLLMSNHQASTQDLLETFNITTFHITGSSTLSCRRSPPSAMSGPSSCSVWASVIHGHNGSMIVAGENGKNTDISNTWKDTNLRGESEKHEPILKGDWQILNVSQPIMLLFTFRLVHSWPGRSVEHQTYKPNAAL